MKRFEVETTVVLSRRVVVEAGRRSEAEAQGVAPECPEGWVIESVSSSAEELRPVHGTAARREQGCNCRRCKAVSAAYFREWKKRKDANASERTS